MLITHGNQDHVCVTCKETIDKRVAHVNLGHGYRGGTRGRICIPCVKKEIMEVDINE